MWMVSGSDLYTGQVMYLGNGLSTSSRWVYKIEDAYSFEKKEVDQALKQAQLDHQANRVVDPYVIQVNQDRMPAKKRERVRVEGPSVRPDLPPLNTPTQYRTSSRLK